MVLVDSKAQECPEDEAVSQPCVCGNETIYQNYCCDGVWSLATCDEPIDQGEENQQDYIPDVIDEGAPSVKKLNAGDDSSGCQLSRF